MLVFVAAVCSVLGLVVGSFLNVVIHRVPNNQSVVAPRSSCPSCGTELANRDNIPVVSWLVLRGRCRTCGTAISKQYPLVELATGLLFGLMGLRFGETWALGGFLFWTAGLVALSVVDLHTYRLPNRILYPTLATTSFLLVAAAVLHRDARGAAEAAAGGVIAFLLLFVVYFASPKAMGFGDVRLAGLVGVALGWVELPLVGIGLLLSFVFASVVGIGLMAAGKRSRKDRVPFGPFLAAGSLVAVLLSEPILTLYLGR